MKATLTFDLPEDECSFRIAGTAMEWALTCFEIDQILRNYLKYGHEFKTIDEALETVRTRLNEELANRNISLEMIE